MYQFINGCGENRLMELGIEGARNWPQGTSFHLTRSSQRKTVPATSFLLRHHVCKQEATP